MKSPGYMDKLGLLLLGSYMNTLRSLWQNISITPCEALVYMMLDTRYWILVTGYRFPVKKRASRIKHQVSSIEYQVSSIEHP